LGALASHASVEIDRCGFPIDDISIDPTNDALIDALARQLPVVGFDTIVADLNRDVERVAEVAGGPDGLAYGFVWDDEENDKAWWIPQGISGSADASEDGLVAGRRIIAVSWYYDIDRHPGTTGEKGARISWVDITDPDAPRYRMALLVEPTGRRPTSRRCRSTRAASRGSATGCGSPTPTRPFASSTSPA
jgi:hypothetical protein